MTKDHIYDTIIIGGGPAGLSAGIYAGRATMDTLIIEGDQIGGQVVTTSIVANYPAVETIDGTELVNKMQQQAKDFGVNFVADTVLDYNFNEPYIKTVTGKKDVYSARSIIIATGAKPHEVGFEGEHEFRGRGVAYCSTCDGELFSELEVFVIGGGYAAAEEADYLTRFARHVTVVMRSSDFTCAPLTADRARSNDRITILPYTEVVSVTGQDYLSEAHFINNQTHETTTYHLAPDDNTFGMFIYVGTDPQTKLFKKDITLDENQYILTNSTGQSNIPGVFAAGDVISKPLRQIVTAASDGANAATSAELYVTALKKSLNIAISRQVTNKKARTTLSQTSAIEERQPAVTQNRKSHWFANELVQQLQPIFNKLEQDIVLSQLTDNSEKSRELTAFLQEFSALNSHIQFVSKTIDQSTAHHLPYFKLMTATGLDTGIQFSGIPTDHELNSLVLAIYNTAGPGQTIDSQLVERIKKLPKTAIAIGVSLTCHFCPDVVAACQHIAALNPHVSAEMIDLQLFPDIREKHHIMSVPAMIFNQSDQVIFGSQSLEDIVTAIETTN
ncbi:FAD-dependent oxidoreductase [Leuconostoc gasicomitatum]|uniref:FAD-dependent oxidoreductase n=1 Tax=Leuconostoc gasicomitatum TaxID=115778 RepID=UPI001CC680D6|nr:FAD-dependent oxidoreductase [Leuconostoc gasicomitatum]MBZ5969999.1 FAD-dependent oxidoreductase [Leuconostoc gasicomitatum]MBZ5998191.1 FAD-dependent oxidoreductase [Leuconostoc gasicomitatum]